MSDKIGDFDGEVPRNYDRYLGPVWFEPYADDLSQRVASAGAAEVLELACGTGILTRRLLDRLAAGTKLVATDLSGDMLDYARAKLPANGHLQWRQADALALPFADAQFDAVACQFGWMFLPDKVRAAREALRVLRPGGRLYFNVWDSLARNDLPRVAQSVLEERFPGNAPQFLPFAFGCHDRAALVGAVKASGFTRLDVAEVQKRGTASSAHDVATGLLTGLPIRHALQIRGADVAELIDVVATRLAEKFGDPPASANLLALVVTASR